MNETSESIIKGLLVVHVGVSTISSSWTSMYAVSIYLFAVALLLFAAVVLFIVHWRHQVVKSRKKKRTEDNPDSPGTPLTLQYLYRDSELRTYEKAPSVDSVKGYNRYSQYDNYMANDYQKDYEVEFSRKTDNLG